MALMQNSPLVSTAWLSNRLNDSQVRILDASWFMPDSGRDPAKDYAERHIPGAVFFGVDEISDHADPLPHMLSAPADFAVAVRRLGVGSDSIVVVYDSVGLFSAPRVWWNFRAMGHQSTYVLDGGLPRWLDEGRPVETGWRETLHADFKSRPDSSLVRNLADMTRILADSSAQILDARPEVRFTGAAPEPRAGLRGGHMPGALNLPFTSLVEGGALRSPEDLRSVFATAGVDLGRPMVTSCGSGISAALLALALARIGRADIAVYDGSWVEWGGRADTAVVTGAD